MKETVNDVSITSDVLREVVEVLRPFVQPLEEIDESFQLSLAQYGSEGLDIVKNSYTVNGRVVADHDGVPLDATSLDSWPPVGAEQYTTTFHIRRHFPGSRWANTAMYVQIEASTWGWASVLVFADDGGYALAVMDAVMAVIKSHPAQPQQAGDPGANTVFIGHGGDRQWEVVRDYLVTGGVNVEAFESGERASLLTLDVVGQMIRSSRLAVIVLTGADATGDGRLLARQNVVHELGFAHGALGIENTIVLLEQGTEEFTNIAGLTQIRFSRGEIHTTKDRVLALIAQRSEIGWGGGC